MARVYDKYVEQMQHIADINGALAVLHWDKEVCLPEGGNAFRSRQMAALSGIIHESFTDKSFGALLNKLKGMSSLSLVEKRNIAITLEDYEKATRFTKEFVMKKTMAISKAFQSWEAARKANDFQVHQDDLDHLLTIIKEEASILNHPSHPYNGLLHQYEPNLTVDKLEDVFSQFKEEMLPFIKKLTKKKAPKHKFLAKTYPSKKQWDFGVYLLEYMGYDFHHGRQDLSTHPFTIGFSPDDVRVTTRIDDNDFSNMTWSCIHEGGHALYEQGLDKNHYGLPSGNAISLSIHESQSRLWENNVGRSKAYWKYHFPVLQQLFPNNLKKVSLDSFYQAINIVRPNLIRTEADELHYHLHIMIRYEIEKAIMEGKVATADLKLLWNEKYKEYLGVKVPDDLNGILQDVHWSHGSIGYFPTYSLGSFYAAQFFEAAKNQVPRLKKYMAKGDTAPLLDWLRTNIHQHGRSFEAEELCQNITGEVLNIKYFIEYATKKYSKLFL